jgi:hypothetical protein
LRQATLAHKENIDPNPSKSNRKERRTLSEIHAKVRDDYDGSFIEDERPPVVSSNTARPTRFSNANLSNQIADAVEKASQEAYAKEIRRAKARAAAAGDTGTQQSFLLPDLPNLSDLVSGVYEDGTPVYTRQPKTRTTRFVSPPADAMDVSLSREHIPLDAIPIPEDEKALFVSLRLLQDKVSELERGKVEAEKKLEDLRQENHFLKGKSSQREKGSRSSKRYDLDQNDHKKDRLQNEIESKCFGPFTSTPLTVGRIGSKELGASEQGRPSRAQERHSGGCIKEAKQRTRYGGLSTWRCLPGDPGPEE